MTDETIITRRYLIRSEGTEYEADGYLPITTESGPIGAEFIAVDPEGDIDYHGLIINAPITIIDTCPQITADEFFTEMSRVHKAVEAARTMRDEKPEKKLNIPEVGGYG